MPRPLSAAFVGIALAAVHFGARAVFAIPSAVSVPSTHHNISRSSSTGDGTSGVRPQTAHALGSAGSDPTVYAADPADSWNRLFAALMTRTVRVRYTDEFPDRGPFQRRRDPMRHAPMRVSTRTFDRYESGDRAVDALYPTFLNQIGPREALNGPLHAALIEALHAAIDDRTPRTPIARALMLQDLWSAFDPLAAIERSEYAARGRFIDPRTRADQQAAAELTAPIAKLIARIALAPAEIAALPDTYDEARRTLPLPDVFRRNGEWMEIVWGTLRSHDIEAGYRRLARVFVRPDARPRNPLAFLTSATRSAVSPFPQVALVMQALTIDSNGRVVATPIVTDVQVRTLNGPPGPAATASVDEYELSRARLLSNASGGPLIHFADRADAYIAAAGNDYGFATPPIVRPGSEAIVSTLHTRCTTCHGPLNTGMMSFAVQDPDRMPPPRILPQPNDERALFAASQKPVRDDFKRLIALSGLR